MHQSACSNRLRCSEMSRLYASAARMASSVAARPSKVMPTDDTVAAMPAAQALA